MVFPIQTLSLHIEWEAKCKHNSQHVIYRYSIQPRNSKNFPTRMWVFSIRQSYSKNIFVFSDRWQLALNVESVKVAQASRIWVSFEGKNVKNALKWSFHWNSFYFFCNSMDLHLHNNINTLQSVSFLRNHLFVENENEIVCLS